MKILVITLLSSTVCCIGPSASAQGIFQDLSPVSSTQTVLQPITSAESTQDTAPAAGAQSPVSQSLPTIEPTATPDLGSGFFTRLANYYKLEWGKPGLPSDPNAPASRRSGFPPQPENSPPMPFTEWPYGGTTSIGVNRAGSVDSPLMAALAPSGLGKALASAHIQVYGWIDVGGNFSTNHVKGGNAPGAYNYDPRHIQLDQAVIYVERTPDTVQTDHVDWGFRVSGIYGVDYRYTTSYGLFSNQLLGKDGKYGYDLPMIYGEVYIPKVADGFLVRFGRFISLPDIEAQLAPNNYMYSHSLTYTFDNYTNTGIQGTLAVSKNLFLQLGVSIGSDTALWNYRKTIANPFPNPLYPGTRYRKDPGALPSVTGCIRYETNSARDGVYFCADAINSGTYGYNNLQWYGMTYYHRFNDKLHIAFETYNLHQTRVPNVNNPIVTDAIAMGGTPFSPQNVPFNAPNGAQCDNPNALTCKASAQSFLTYLNYQFTPLDNISLRAEYYDDQQGQRTGVKTRYASAALGIQHWLSPQFELRPEVAYYKAFDAPAFNGNGNLGIAPNKKESFVISGDIIAHF